MESGFFERQPTPEKRETKKPAALGTMREYLDRLHEMFPEFRPEYEGVFLDAKKLFKTLSPAKRIHSRNVSLRVATIIKETETILAALLHDTKERKPAKFEKQRDDFHPHVIDCIEALTEEETEDLLDEDEQNAPLAHIQSILPSLDPNIRDRVIIIKLADRLDNLQRRKNDKKLSKKYRKKSIELVRYLASEFVQDPKINQQACLELTDEIAALTKRENPFLDRLEMAA